MNKALKTMWLNRFKSLIWRAGAMGAVVGVGYLAQEIKAFELDPVIVVAIGLILGEVTKFLNSYLSQTATYLQPKTK